MDEVREAYVTDRERATYAELSERFGVPASTIGNAAADESWVALRAGHLDQMTRAADASSVLLEAVQSVNRPVIASFTSVVLATLHGLAQAIAEIKPELASSTKLEMFNTASFALKNTADACKSIGIIGLPKALNDAGDVGNGRWNPQMLSQINLTVQNLVGQAAGKEPVAVAHAAAPVSSDVPAPS